ncbi:YkgJ family cysteine cluster protein [Geomonas nitrogeniifigens]|uniref:YkgJ family cysteine cluster protein n=1 Tax=Geomonas diazotrophica TaxID=2843197 RepID=A0ABX8JME6_9BACT|nr:YkgJ family cysteine cluster protein [Geomonas nitrogeniifigens]QWV99530.1 YkgJ family cysteine cluster protein [Geomonas nitrogeniifigens]QXE88705.1 YkgJ family cysteine cluster protein [Geomonas nitrogeniifigens]
MQELLNRNRELLAQVDDWFARCMASYPEHIACRSGCSSCCRGTFDVTLLDAYYLKRGFDLLPDEVKERVLAKCRDRLALMREQWPELDHPFVLNYRPEEDWELLMPDEDETPCVLLGDDGRCLVYENRPMTCRLHGIPLVDTAGEVMHEEWCTMNFTEVDPLTLPGLTAPFDSILREEVALFRDFTERFLGRRMSELDTLIPTALMIDFDGFDWKRWARKGV